MFGSMDLVIFGATGRTGLCCVEIALNAGYNVTAFVRDQSRLPYDLQSRVGRVVEGDVLNQDDVNEAVRGNSGVIVALGTRDSLEPSTMMSEGTDNILKAMNYHGVRSIRLCLSSFLLYESNTPPQYTHIIDEHRRMYDMVKDMGGLEWVAVCPPRITEEAGSGNFQITKNERGGGKISKYDLADFMVKSFGTNEYDSSMITLHND